MYLDHFHLKEEPFATTPDPKFLYKSAVHQEALDRLTTAVALRRGINAIIGEPGLGKSMMIRTMLMGFRKNVRFAWVFNTQMNARELIRYICRDFGFKPKGADLADLLMELANYLTKQYEKGYYALVIVDEAQNLSFEGLEQIRQLSNLETSRNKLLQIILSGQLQLNQRLDEPDLHQLKQRISLKAVLHRMDRSDTLAYIQHRLSVVGAERDELFDEAALEGIFRITDGIPRLINQVCENALMLAAQKNENEVTLPIIDELVKKGQVTEANLVSDENEIQPEAAKPESQPTVQTPIPAVRSQEQVMAGVEQGDAQSWDDFDGLDLNELAIN